MQVERHRASAWFQKLQESIVGRFERLESAYRERFKIEDEAAKFTVRLTKTRDKDGSDRGGGKMASLKGNGLFEKVGVNSSTVYGNLSEGMLRQLTKHKSVEGLREDSRFWASGISLVAHMTNPKVPAVHFNTRMFWTPSRWWFGGGADLNPSIEIAEDTSWFHAVLKECCDKSDPGYYDKFRDWADNYFFIPHRGMHRGVGGIFFDELNSGDWEADFRFVCDVGRAFNKAYLPIVMRRWSERWTESDRNMQLLRRGCYAEFNLVYDRGTKFGLESGHDADAVLMSLPPIATWK